MPHNLRLPAVRWLGALIVLLFGAFVALPAAGAATSGSHPQSIGRASTASVPKVLRVGTEGTYPPFDFNQNGKLTGYDVEVVQQIAQRLGVKVQFVQIPFDSLFAALKAGRIDMIADQITINSERKSLYDLSSPYVDTTGVIVARSSEKNIHSLADIKGKRAAESSTSNWGDIARKAGAKIQTVEGLDQSLSLLQQGRIDVLVNDQLAVKYAIRVTGATDVKIVGTTPDASQSAFAARKGSGFMPQIDTQIAAMKSDGSLKKTYDKWFTVQPKVPSTWDTIRTNLVPMLKGLVTGTLPLTAISFVAGLVIALGVAIARMSNRLVLSGVARAYIAIIRGTPLLVQLFIIFFGLPELGVKFSPFPAAIIAFSLNVGGYAAETIRAAIQSIPRGQWEAASSVGMNYPTALRRVIIPQAARTAVPPLSNELISLVKDTSLASTIIVTELLRKAQDAAAPSGKYLELYSTAAVYYLVVCLILAFAQDRLEGRLGRFVAR
ncbi:ABC transporter substrate-binding protein/permease [Allobranchiibius sp. CTAmp26]|uniref:ABC transporter substrate-binding protein/permease n=1 Tax=Allobranchiibius sp. CTAmp26 TaxID=2815214 RepID=UPI001AA1A175|nr:ABC transporter substrate-binding protein/permease [Allobranchiibius sp. CTAmp26]MBO1756693.1 ABC transporter substrate-binding protein/permease [Allobranchiibius sp. CTAmp26]